MITDQPESPVGGPAPVPPVFVDATGRRAKRIERIAAVVVLACMGYGLALLIAALTGVPIEGAIVPYPALGEHSHPSRPPATPSGPTPTLATPAPSAGATSPSPSQSHGSTTPTKHATKTPGARPTTAATHPSPHATTTARGKSTSAPGASKRPTAHPTAAPTTRGRSIR